MIERKQIFFSRIYQKKYLFISNLMYKLKEKIG